MSAMKRSRSEARHFPLFYFDCLVCGLRYGTDPLFHFISFFPILRFVYSFLCWITNWSHLIQIPLSRPVSEFRQ